MILISLIGHNTLLPPHTLLVQIDTLQLMIELNQFRVILMLVFKIFPQPLCINTFKATNMHHQLISISSLMCRHRVINLLYTGSEGLY